MGALQRPSGGCPYARVCWGGGANANVWGVTTPRTPNARDGGVLKPGKGVFQRPSRLCLNLSKPRFPRVYPRGETRDKQPGLARWRITMKTCEEGPRISSRRRRVTILPIPLVYPRGESQVETCLLRYDWCPGDWVSPRGKSGLPPVPFLTPPGGKPVFPGGFPPGETQSKYVKPCSA